MTERAFKPQPEIKDDSRELERRYERGSFSFKLTEKLNKAESARQAWGRCDETSAREKSALAFAEAKWPCDAKLNVTLPEDAQVFDKDFNLVEDRPDVFTADHFAGFDHRGARFLDVAADVWARVPDVRQAEIRIVGEGNHYNGYE